MTTTSISASTLLSYLQVRTGQTGANSSTSGLSAATVALLSKAPIAPWNSATTSTTSTAHTPTTVTTPSSAAEAASTLAEQILAGKTLVDPTKVKLSLTGSDGNANTDYQNLFALYQGLTSLQSLASAASATTTTTAQLAILQKAFASGLSQVRAFVASGAFKEFAISDGSISSSATTGVGVQQSSDTYDTAPLVKTSPNDVVASLSGAVAFDMTATSLQGQSQTVDFNLDDMGSTPRTLSNVVTYLNGQLKAAGLTTRFATNLMAGSPAVTTTNSSGVTTTVTPATPDQYGLQINGTPNELLSFSAASSTPAVYIAQTSSDPSATSTTATTSTTTTATTVATTTTSGTATTAPAVTSQFLKLDQPATSGAATTRGFTDTLPAGSTVTATATAPDGSVYVLANVTATTSGQTLQGTQDAALFKYDSAGNLISTRVLGDAGTVKATALAVSADGSQVAVAGSTTGGSLDPTDTTQNSSTTAQSFVQVYNGAGEPLWNFTQDGTDDNQANAVGFGPGNSVYIAGQTMARLPGATSAGAQDGYVQGFNVTSVVDKLAQTTSYTATSAFTQEFGTSGIDRATGVAVSGSSVYVSSVENGQAVVRQYTTTTTTSSSRTVPTEDGTGTSTTTKITASLGAMQTLGALNGGNVSGLAIAADGSVLVTGSTHNAALNAGTVTSAYTGNGDAFVAKLNANLNPAQAEDLAYYNAGGPTTASAITVSGNSAYITGQIAGASIYTPAKGFAAAIDPTSGAPSWSTTFTGNNGSAIPSSIAVASNGASVLDALGLPSGALQIQNQPSQLITANSSVQAGDSFYVQVGSGLAQKVTISANDTYETLAEKIKTASGYNANVTAMTLSAGQQLRIQPANASVGVRLEAGPAGQDALASLGLKEGLISSVASTAAPTTLDGQKVTSQIKSHYSVTVPSALSLTSTSAVTSTTTALATAVAEVQQIYRDMTTAKSTTTGSSSGTVPAYLTAQISNYKLALARLTGGSSSTSGGSSSAALSILKG